MKTSGTGLPGLISSSQLEGGEPIPREPEGEATRVLVVYNVVLFRDIIVGILETAGVLITSVIAEPDLSAKRLAELDYNVVVMDGLREETIDLITHQILRGSSARDTRVIAIDPSRLITLVYHKEELTDAGIKDLISLTYQATREPRRLSGVGSPATADGER